MIDRLVDQRAEQINLHTPVAQAGNIVIASSDRRKPRFPLCRRFLAHIQFPHAHANEQKFLLLFSKRSSFLKERTKELLSV
jgi:hypothetical protein